MLVEVAEPCAAGVHVMQVWFGNTPVVFVSDPDAARYAWAPTS